MAIGSFIFYNHVKPKKGEKIRKKVEAATLTKLDLIEIVKDLPSWVSLDFLCSYVVYKLYALFFQVHFPDRERAEWLNEVPLVPKIIG